MKFFNLFSKWAHLSAIQLIVLYYALAVAFSLVLLSFPFFMMKEWN